MNRFQANTSAASPDSYDHLLKKRKPLFSDAREDANLKLVVVLALCFILMVNVAAFIYRRDMPQQVVILPYDHAAAPESNTVIRVPDKDTYQKIVNEYFPRPQVHANEEKLPEITTDGESQQVLERYGIQWEIFGLLVTVLVGFFGYMIWLVKVSTGAE